jgi:hypothetical protein
VLAAIFPDKKYWGVLRFFRKHHFWGLSRQILNNSNHKSPFKHSGEIIKIIVHKKCKK